MKEVNDIRNLFKPFTSFVWENNQKSCVKCKDFIRKYHIILYLKLFALFFSYYALFILRTQDLWQYNRGLWKMSNWILRTEVWTHMSKHMLDMWKIKWKVLVMHWWVVWRKLQFWMRPLFFLSKRIGSLLDLPTELLGSTVPEWMRV